jgi:hypothetical protein
MDAEQLARKQNVPGPGAYQDILKQSALGEYPISFML